MKNTRQRTSALILLIIMICGTGINPEVLASDENSSRKLSVYQETEALANVILREFNAQQEGQNLLSSIIVQETAESVLNEGGLVLAGKGCLDDFGSVIPFRMVVGRRALVPVICSENPLKKEILVKGISREAFARIYQSNVSWGSVLGTMDNSEIKAYMPGESCMNSYLEDFIGSRASYGTKVDDPDAMIARIADNKYALGFCSLACLKKLEEEGRSSELTLVPIDHDSNGTVDVFENIYNSCNDLGHGIYLGKYPGELYGRMYVLAGKKPVEGTARDFMQWMIGDGQEVLAGLGFLALDKGEQHAANYKLNEVALSLDAGEDQAGTPGIIFYASGILLIVALLIWAVSRFYGRREEEELSPVGAENPQTDRSFPGGYFFDRTHTWTFMEKDGNVRIGVDAFIRDICGPLSRIQVRENGAKVKKGDALVTLVQDGKQLVLASPVSGVVISRNEELSEDASVMNAEPYGEGWVCMVQPSNWTGELRAFLMGDSAGKWFRAEMDRMKALFSGSSLVLQDGGEVRTGVLQNLGPEAWEEFQTGFIDGLS